LTCCTTPVLIGYDHPGHKLRSQSGQRLAKYPRNFWYPWQFYGKRYDEYAAIAEGDFKYGPISSKAMTLLAAKADAGDSEAEERLGIAYLNGNKVTQDYTRAYDWLSKAAEQNNTMAEKHLAWLYDNGIGGAPDESKAFELYLRAANQNDAVAERNIGIRYERGLGVVQDLSKAVQWYKKAAIQGDNDAQDRLGFDLLEGRGVSKDQEQGFARLLYATRDNAHARYALAECYANGVFVKRDLMDAYKWCLIALEKDQEAYNLSQRLKQQLTDAQISQAEKEG
jgi:uncharacterized protein